MRNLRLILWMAPIFVALTWACTRHPPSSAASAAGFISTLSKQSPTHDGVPLRRYDIRDLDDDGSFEVLEHVSAYEDTPGFLNTELEDAFEWINVYRQKSGQFIQATNEFPSFLTVRKDNYQFWLRVLDCPDVLNGDSRMLVEKNRSQFKEALSKYLVEVERLSH